LSILTIVNEVNHCLLEVLFEGIVEGLLMPIVSIRNIIQAGGCKTVAIPPAWLRAFHLDLGDRVLMVADGVIVIAPTGTKLESKQLQLLIDVVNRSDVK
jgi:antitoxin component of MazEF toxin-antitoxin module